MSAFLLGAFALVSASVLEGCIGVLSPLRVDAIGAVEITSAAVLVLWLARMWRQDAQLQRAHDDALRAPLANVVELASRRDELRIPRRQERR